MSPMRCGRALAHLKLGNALGCDKGKLMPEELDCRKSSCTSATCTSDQQPTMMHHGVQQRSACCIFVLIVPL